MKLGFIFLFALLYPIMVLADTEHPLTEARLKFKAEDYIAKYQSFAQSNFQAYDFDTLKAAMVDYIRLNYPEDYNDWIQSSEFISLMDLIAFMGHNLAFRTDFATRENFMETAQSRDSILRLARFLGYNPTRNINSSGVLKIVHMHLHLWNHSM